MRVLRFIAVAFCFSPSQDPGQGLGFVACNGAFCVFEIAFVDVTYQYIACKRSE